MPWGDDWGFDDPIYDTPDWGQIPEYVPGEIELQDIPLFETDPFEGGYLGGDGDGSNWNWLKVLGGLGGGSGGGSGSGSGSGGVMDLLKMLGLSSGGGLGSLLGLLAAGGGAWNANNAIGDAGKKLEDAANKSNEFAQGQYDKAQGRFQPYVDSGLSALAQLQQPSPTLADKFVSKGQASSLASLIKPR